MDIKNSSNQSSEKCDEKFPLIDIWIKYEDIAMHFNDLILKIRVQALAVVAAISAIVGLLSNTVSGSVFSWKIMALVFFFLNFFWVAIWIIDFKYYNRLLSGAVRAILNLEELSKTQNYVTKIELSTMIEDAVAGKKFETAKVHKKKSSGRWWFYVLVYISLLWGLLFSIYKVL